MMPHFRESKTGDIESDVYLQDMSCIPANSFKVGRNSLQESLGRATYVLIRSVKTNKELLLERVTEPGEYAGTRLGGRYEKEGRKCLWGKQFHL